MQRLYNDRTPWPSKKYWARPSISTVPKQVRGFNVRSYLEAHGAHHSTYEDGYWRIRSFPVDDVDKAHHIAEGGRQGMSIPDCLHCRTSWSKDGTPPFNESAVQHSLPSGDMLRINRISQSALLGRFAAQYAPSYSRSNSAVPYTHRHNASRAHRARAASSWSGSDHPHQS